MRVLVATDLSKPADEAVRQGAALAGADGTLAVMHVVPSLQTISMLFPQQHAQDALDVAKITVRVMDALREQVGRTGGREAEFFVDQGTDYAEIVRRAESWKADIVVVGSHGHSGLSWVLGGVAERVVRHAHCRVLVARASAARGCVLAGTDLSEPSLPAVTAAAEEARRRGVALKTVHAVGFVEREVLYLLAPHRSDQREPARVRLTEMMHKAGATGESLILDGSAAAAIVREAEASGAELIVIATHGKTGIARVFGSVAEKLVRTAPCSVLVVRAG